MDGLYLNTIFSDKTHYGVIWSGKYRGQNCIIKVVLLDTGIHYDKKNKRYLDDELKISKSNAIKFFEKDDKIPYLHTKYITRKSMSIGKFRHEISMLQKVYAIGLAPKLLNHWIDSTSYRMHYGFIIMERMTMTVKDILLHRDLSSDELNYIRSKIRKLHHNHIKHGDLKPSNIGVNLNKSGYIKHIRMIDWAKGEYTDDKNKFKRDIRTFKSHIRKNIMERV